MATFLKHEPCTRCGSRDNFARYSDGGGFCFGCRYSERANGTPFKRLADAANECTDAVQTSHLPEGSESILPARAISYLSRYGITMGEVLRQGIVWSPRDEQLIYPYYATTDDGRKYLACYQARNFNQSRQAKAKYFNKGSTSSVIPVIKCLDTTVKRLVIFPKRLVITEDALSAIRIARQCDAMPALGTNVPVHKIMVLARSYERITIWLDSDKWREAREIADNVKWLGLSADTIYSELDPKAYTDEQITEYLK
jgi:hypothetical protein